MAVIKVQLDFDFADCRYNGEVWRTIDDLFIREYMQPIDTPTNPAATLFCTPDNIRAHINKERKKVAEMISEEITAALMDQLSKNDLFDGYPSAGKEES